MCAARPWGKIVTNYMPWQGLGILDETILHFIQLFREGVEYHHLYGDLGQQVDKLKSLTGPVYEVERTHTFQVENGYFLHCKTDSIGKI
jgi:hypothetical protein